MAVEIEAKIKVESLAVVREKLKHLGAESVGTVLEVNTFLDTDERNLLAADKGLRVRQTRTPGGADKVTATYKGPRNPGQLKNREEIEVNLSSNNHGVALFEALGFHRILSFEKHRETWKLDGCLIELDELPHLGVYVEIEGPADAQIFGVRSKLGLDKNPLVTASYIAMLLTYLQENGITSKNVTFGKA